ncbi:MAG: hypothetical protein P8J91_01220, partial [Pirellulaceae bacterium]|nr:hypothetical protein [Pirellulaceae bacterium]
MIRFTPLSVLTITLIFAPSAGGQENITHVDRDGMADHQVVVDREAGQYLGHPTTVLLEDGQTMLCVYPKGHGKGGIVY